MPEFKTLRLVDIDVDFSIQPRVNGLNQDHVDDLEAAYKDENTTIEPPVVWLLPDESYKLSQGFHRIEGAKRAGRDSLKCLIRRGTAVECAIDAFCSNQGHGLKRTNADKRRAVERLLKLMGSSSDRAIAEKAGVSHNFVSEIRPKVPQLSSDDTSKSNGQVSSDDTSDEKRIGSDGKKYPASKKKKGSGASTSKKPTAPGPNLPQDESEPVNQPNAATDDQTTPVQVGQEPPAPEEPAEDETTVMGKLNALLKQVKQLVKKNPALAKDAAVAIHEVGAEVILFTPELKYGETRPLYESSYFRLKNGNYEGPHVQRLEGIGIKAIDTYGRMVPQELRDEFCEKRYQQVERHLQEAVMQLHAADVVYKALSARGLGVPWFNDEAWGKAVTKGAKLVSDGLSAWMFDALPYSICLFCNGHKKDEKGMRCLKCKFTGYWPKNEVNIHPTMIKDMRPKVAPTQEAKA